MTAIGIMAGSLAPVGYKSAIGSTAGTASSNNLVITTLAPVSVNDLVVVRWAADNLTASTPTGTITDSAGNTYTTHCFTGVNATGAAGVVGGMAATRATVALPVGGTITLTLSAAVNNKVLHAQSFSGLTNTLRNAVVMATGASTTPSVVSGAATAGDLVVGTCAIESRTAPSAYDTDVVNGYWSSSILRQSNTTGTDNTLVEVVGQHKLVNASGAQTYNLTITSTEWAAMVAIFVPG